MTRKPIPKIKRKTRNPTKVVSIRIGVFFLINDEDEDIREKKRSHPSTFERKEGYGFTKVKSNVLMWARQKSNPYHVMAYQNEYDKNKSACTRSYQHHQNYPS